MWNVGDVGVKQKSKERFAHFNNDIMDVLLSLIKGLHNPKKQMLMI